MNDGKSLMIGLYDRVAPKYGQVGPLAFARFGPRLVELIDLSAGDVVLDVATGRGANLFAAAEAVGPNGRVVGIDLSAEMVKETDAQLALTDLKNIEVVQMDGEALEFENSAFDALLCGYAIFWFDELPKALAEFRRVLKPSGKIGISMYGGSDPRWGWYGELLRAYDEKVGGYTRFGGNHVNGKPDRLEEALWEAGFTNVASSIEPFEIVYPNAEEWWNEKWTHGSRAPLEQMSPVVLAEFKAEAFAQLDTMREPDGFHMIWNSCFMVAYNPNC